MDASLGVYTLSFCRENRLESRSEVVSLSHVFMSTYLGYNVIGENRRGWVARDNDAFIFILPGSVWYCMCVGGRSNLYAIRV